MRKRIETVKAAITRRRRERPCDRALSTRVSASADSATNTAAKSPINPQDEAEAREQIELDEKGAGDVASVSWGLDKHIKAEILYALDAPTGLAIRMEILGLSDRSTVYLGAEASPGAVTLQLPREEKGNNEVRIGIPELVLGSPYDLIFEDATREDIQLLESDAYAGLADGRFVHARVFWDGGYLVLEVELPDAPVFIFSVCEDSRNALALRVGRERMGGHSQSQVVYVEVPNGVFGDIRRSSRSSQRQITSTKQRTE